MIKKLTFLFITWISFAINISAQNGEGILTDSLFFQQNLNSFAKGNNHRRYRFIKNYSKINKLTNLSVKTQAIDWLGLYRNVIFEKTGETDSIIYIVCHYDKIDGSLLTLPNLLLNGSLDILFSNIFLSKGAYDNGTGVVSLLGLLWWINDHRTHYTFRFLFAGMEEYGLRGSRTHVSRLSKEEWDKCILAINIDMIAQKGTKGITVTANVSDNKLLRIARHVSEVSDFQLAEVAMPKGALSDYYSFTGQSFSKDFAFSFMVNLVVAFLPQKSYFTKRKQAIPVINFSDDTQFTAADYLSIISPISFGTVHSFHDKLGRVSFKSLVEYSRFFKLYINSVDRNGQF
jgi:Peptidase family M28